MITSDRTSIYERVLVAAREARRINDKQATQHIVPLKKATTEAIQRLKENEIAYELEPKPDDTTAAAPNELEDEGTSTWN